MSLSLARRIAGAGKFMAGGAMMLVVEALRRKRSANGDRSAHRDVDCRTTDSECSGLAVSRHGEVYRSDWADLLEREVNELTALADQIYDIAAFARHEDEVGADTFVRLDDLRWILGSYVLKGSRIRRLAQLPELVESVAGQRQPADSVGNVGRAAADLLERIQDTNSVTVDWLLSHRVALPDPDFLDSNALRDRYNRLEIEPTTVSGDPLYLLTCHIHDMLETTEALSATDHSPLDRLEAQLARPVIAIENEIKAAMAFNTALLGTAHDVVRSAAPGLAV